MSLSLYHHGIKGQQWGVRNGPPYPLVSGSNKSVTSRRRNAASKTKAKVDNIVSSLSRDEKDKLGIGKDETDYLTIEEGEHVLKRVLKEVGAIPVSFFDMLDDGDTIQLAFATRSGEEYRGKGYGSSAAKQAIDWLDKHPNVQRGRDVVWGVRTDNQASIAVAKKLGFKVDKDSYNDGWINYVRKPSDRRS